MEKESNRKAIIFLKNLKLLFISLLLFIFFSILGKGSFDIPTTDLPVRKTFISFLLITAKIVFSYFIVLKISIILGNQYYSIFSHAINKRLSLLLKFTLSSFIPILFVLRQAIYAPGFAESYVDKGSIPFMSRDFLINISLNIPLVVIDVLLVIFILIPVIIFVFNSRMKILQYCKLKRTWSVGLIILTIFLSIYTGSHLSNNNRPNILFIGIDSLKPDHLSINGHQRKTSPTLDSILKKSVVFKNAYTTIPRTSPSLVSMFTGVNPNLHGIRHMFPRFEDRNVQFKTLVNVLNDNNYKSSVFTDYAGEFFDNVKLGFQYKGVPYGFSYYSVISRGLIYKHIIPISFLWNKIARIIIPEVNFLPIYSDPKIPLDKGWDFISTFSDQKANFFTTIFLSSVHLPYTITYPHYKKWQSHYTDGANLFAYSKRDLKDVLESSDNNDELEAKQISLLYDRAIYTTDVAIEVFWKKLQASGILKNTIVLFFSDHGENLPVKGDVVEHGTTLSENDDDTKMFFALYLPERLKKKKKILVHEIDMNVRIIDIMPTILSLADLSFEALVQGRDLTPLLKGEKNHDLSNLPIFIENGLSFNSSNDFGEYEDALKYPGILELIDTEDDFPYYFILKKKYGLDINQSKWRKIVINDRKLLYIPRKSGATFKLFNTNQEEREDNEKLKKTFFELVLKEPAVIINGNNNVEYKN